MPDNRQNRRSTPGWVSQGFSTLPTRQNTIIILRRTMLLPRIAAFIVTLTGSLVLVGWALDIPLLKSIFPGLATMKASTALCFVLVGMALWLLADGQVSLSRRRLAQGCVLAVLLIGGLTLVQYLTGWNLGIDELLFRDAAPGPGTQYPGRMAEATVFSFVLVGIALWLISSDRHYRFIHLITLLLMSVALLALAGYLYGVESLYGVFAFSSMSIHTALMFFIAGAGILHARPDRGWMAVVSSDSVGGKMARRLLPAVILLPLILGWIRLRGQQQGLYDTEFGLALFALANIFTLALLVWWNARSLNRIDAEYRQSQAAQLQHETRYHRVLDSLLEGAQIIGYDWRYLYINDAAARQGRLSREAFLGFTMMEKYPGIEQTALFAVLRRCMDERSPQQMDNEFIYPDGARAWFELSIQPLDEGIFILSLDITRRREHEEELKRYTQRMELLHKIDTGIIEASSLGAVIDLAIGHIRRLIPCQRASIGLIDESGEWLHFTGDVDTAGWHNGTLAFDPDWLTLFDTTPVLLIDDLRTAGDLNPMQQAGLREGMVTAIHVLLAARGQPLGIFNLTADTPDFFTGEYQEIAVELAGQLAVAVHERRLSEAVERHQEHLTGLVEQRTAALNRTKEEAERTLFELRDSEAKFRLLLDAAPMATVIIDDSGHISLVNVLAETLFGYARSELVGQPVEMLVPEPLRARHVDNRSGYMAAPRVRPMGAGMELFARHKDGTLFPVEIELSHIQTQAGLLVMAFIVDITERKQVAAELDRQRAFLRKVIDVSPGMIFVKDYNSRFVLANLMVARMYNTTVEALIGKSDADFNASPREVANFLEADRRVISSGEPLFLEEPVTGISGETRWFHTTKVPIVSEDDSTKYVLGIATDITERRQAEEALRQALAKEKELNELKTRFVSMASHEFRTPLATILALTETLVAYRHKLPDEQIARRLSKIQEQVGHLKDVMEDVLMLARMQARRVEFSPARLNLDALCRSVMDEFQSQAGMTHRFDYYCDEHLHSVTLDRKLMRQTLSNLISNAIKYSPPDKMIRLRLEYAGDAMLLKIQDEGIGIPEADMPYLFEPFHRAGNVGTISGTGLGLVITKDSVELHGGNITVESSTETGTTFEVRIPLPLGDILHDKNPAD